MPHAHDSQDATPGSGSILVTGATGLIGSATVQLLLERGDHVVAVDRREAERNDPAVLSVVADVTDESEVAQVFERAQQWRPIRKVVHLAALPSMTAGTASQVFGTNVTSTFTMLATAAERGVQRAVIASSIHATGLLKNHFGPLPDRFPLDEQQTRHIDDWYSHSKQVDELTAAMVASHWGMPVVALRFPLVQPLSRLERNRAFNDSDPSAMWREGWTYLPDTEAARAIACSLDADTEGAVIAHVAAPDTLLSMPTEQALRTYAPQVPRLREFLGHEAPMDTSRAASLLGFSARSRFDLQEQS